MGGVIEKSIFSSQNVLVETIASTRVKSSATVYTAMQDGYLLISAHALNYTSYMVESSHAQWDNYNFVSEVLVCSSDGTPKHTVIEKRTYRDVSGRDTGAGIVANSGYMLLPVEKGDYISAYYSSDACGSNGYGTFVSGFFIYQD